MTHRDTKAIVTVLNRAKGASVLKRIGIVLVGAMTMIALAAVPAQADYCPDSLICFYWTGHRYDFNVTLGSAPWKDVYVGEPVRSNAYSMRIQKVNTYISKRNKGDGCSAFNFDQPNLHQGQQYYFNPVTACFRVDWV